MGSKSNKGWCDAGFGSANPFSQLSACSHTADNAVNETASAVTDAQAAPLPKVKSASIEKKNRGGKLVTVVAFFGSPQPSALRTWLKQAKTEFGCGGCIENACVILQGDWREKLQK